jgi:hypothetical protein
MAQAQNRMLPQHARTGVTHHRSDLFALETLITMDWTLGAGGLVRPKPTALQPDGSIIQKLPALRTKGRVGMVMAFAVIANHRCKRLPFPDKTRANKATAGCFAFFRHWPQAKGFSSFHVSQ